MKKFLTAGKFFFAVFCAIFLMAGKSYAGWHELAQSDRNQRIVAQAQHDLYLVGGECKVWAYDVVRVASNQAGGSGVPVPLPATDNGGYGYAWLYSSNVFSYGALNPSQMVPGMIVQMRVRYANGTYGPHTAIVFANSASAHQLTFIESNYQGDYTVRMRNVYWTDFTASVEPTSHYTVYTIK
ncbi:MAG: hypothetical protein M0P64_03260 [Candidatus Pacebacteria bacterium]|jgi:hypothetical protein|nr:hypothetical protein [Candidatus Paceibacterota bacterium]